MRPKFPPVRRPTSPSEWLVLTIGTAFGLGLMPIAPGSFAALLGVAVHAAAWHWAPEHTGTTLWVAFAVCCTLHFLLNTAAAKYWNDPDSGHFVMDEVAGYLLVAILAWPWVPAPWILIEGFLLFRVLDIVKVPPARQIDRDMHNAVGVILDDLVAAAYTAGILVLQTRLLG